MPRTLYICGAEPVCIIMAARLIRQAARQCAVMCTRPTPPLALSSHIQPPARAAVVVCEISLHAQRQSPLHILQSIMPCKIMHNHCCLHTYTSRCVNDDDAGALLFHVFWIFQSVMRPTCVTREHKTQKGWLVFFLIFKAVCYLL